MLIAFDQNKKPVIMKKNITDGAEGGVKTRLGGNPVSGPIKIVLQSGVVEKDPQSQISSKAIHSVKTRRFAGSNDQGIEGDARREDPAHSKKQTHNAEIGQTTID